MGPTCISAATLQLPTFRLNLQTLIGNRGGMQVSSLIGSMVSMIPTSGFNVKIYRGQDIGKIIHLLLQRREGMPANLREKACLGTIMFTLGYVWNPEVENLGSSELFVGLYQLTGLYGKYNIPRDGDVRICGGLHGNFLGTKGSFGGPLVGPLIAATAVQVIVFVGEQILVHI